MKARAMTGEEGGEMRLEGVEVTFPYVARGEESTATITSDECLYDADRQRARFRGNVVAVTRDGFELRTESLDYLGDEMRVTHATRRWSSARARPRAGAGRALRHGHARRSC